MGDRDYDSFFSSIMLKNIDNQIPIAFNQATPSKTTTPTNKSPSRIIDAYECIYQSHAGPNCITQKRGYVSQRGSKEKIRIHYNNFFKRFS